MEGGKGEGELWKESRKNTKEYQKKKKRGTNNNYHGRWMNSTDPCVYTTDGLVDFWECNGVLMKLFLVVGVGVARGGCHDDLDKPINFSFPTVPCIACSVLRTAVHLVVRAPKV